MKNQQLKKTMKKRTFRYFSGRILIKSDTSLTKQQREEVFKIVRENMQNPYYGCIQQIVREIFYKLKRSVCSVEFYSKRMGYFVRIKSSKTE